LSDIEKSLPIIFNTIHNNLMLYQTKPQNFNPKFDVVSCFLEHNQKILLLHRQDHKPEWNTRGVPAWKVNDGEKILNTMIRELREETSHQISHSKLTYFQKTFVQYPNYDFVYHIYHAKLNQTPIIKINDDEHKDFKRVTPQEALAMDLIQDEDTCIKIFYGL